jgi:hypothetical protein
MDYLRKDLIDMGEQEKLDIIRIIRDEIAELKDYLDAKYASKDSLAQAVLDRTRHCEIREAKLDAKFKPVYYGLGIILLFIVSKYGMEIMGYIK